MLLLRRVIWALATPCAAMMAMKILGMNTESLEHERHPQGHKACRQKGSDRLDRVSLIGVVLIQH